MVIKRIDKDGVGFELGLKAGDTLISFDDRPVLDILDYYFWDGETDFLMTVETCSGEQVEYEIEKNSGETLGLEFDDELIPMTCRNNCVFCFVDQLPKGSRSALNVKDDDYRMSFSMGNYITLTNLKKVDFERIVRLKLSPLYVSVHSTEDTVRRRMMRYAGNFSIMNQLKCLADSGIVLHTQIVYCPGYNDDYINSVRKLSALAETLAIVPVGITKFSNSGLTPVTEVTARKVIADITPLQEEFLKARGDRFVYLADEFYVKAHMSMPAYEHYGNFNQIENGVGLIAKLKHEAELQNLNYNMQITDNVTIATSVSAYDTIKSIAGDRATVIKIINNYFGSSVTVAGLITGRDLVEQLAGKVNGRLLLPRCMFKEGGNVFLDDMTLTELQESLGCEIKVVDIDGESLVKSLFNVG